MSTTYSAAVAASKILDKIGSATDRQDLLNKLDELIQTIEEGEVDNTDILNKLDELIQALGGGGAVESTRVTTFHKSATVNFTSQGRPPVNIYAVTGSIRKESISGVYTFRLDPKLTDQTLSNIYKVVEHYRGDETNFEFDFSSGPIGPCETVSVMVSDEFGNSVSFSPDFTWINYVRYTNNSQ